MHTFIGICPLILFLCNCSCSNDFKVLIVYGTVLVNKLSWRKSISEQNNGLSWLPSQQIFSFRTRDLPSFSRLPISSGIAPVNMLESARNCSSFDKVPSWVGNDPLSLLSLRKIDSTNL